MRRVSQNFYDRVNRGEQPTVYVVIKTQSGSRAYSQRALPDNFDVPTRLLDGAWTLDGSVSLGSGEYMASKDPLVLSYGRSQATLSPKSGELLTGYTSKRQSTFQVVLNNADRTLAQLVASEPFISRPIEVWLGFDDTAYADHQKLWNGEVDEIEISLDSITLNAVEA